MKPEFFIARRIRLRPESGRISAGVVIAVAGVALALCVMIASVAVMLGFKNQIREKVMGFEAQISVSAYSPESGKQKAVNLTDQLREAMMEVLPATAGITPSLTRPVILKTDSDFSGQILKGITPDNSLDLIASNITDGHLPDYSADSTLYHITISRITADKLNLKPGDKINAFFIDNSGARPRKLTVAAIFDTHFSDYDRNILFGNIEMLRRMGKHDPESASVIEISGLKSDKEIDETARQLNLRLSQAYYTGLTQEILTVNTIRQTASMYFNWLELLDTNVAVILVMMILVSGLTLVSSLFIIVLERVNMIGLLKAVGASNSLIRRIFILLTERLVLTGLIIGNAAGICMLYAQKLLRLIPLDPEAYYLDTVPVEINWWWILGINAGVILISAVILILPSRIISGISPAEAIRFE